MTDKMDIPWKEAEPFEQVLLVATARDCAPWDIPMQSQVRVGARHLGTLPLIYDGSDTATGKKRYLLRYTPVCPGRHTVSVAKSAAAGAVEECVVALVVEARAKTHWPLRISSEFPDTILYHHGGLCPFRGFEMNWLFALAQAGRLDEARVFLKEVKAAGFNQVLFNIYAYDTDWFDKSAVQPEHAFWRPDYFPFGGTNAEPDHRRLNLDYFRKLDLLFALLLELDLVAHVMIYVWNKQVSWPALGGADDNRYFDYIIQRYQSYPNVIWNLGKEMLGYGYCDASFAMARLGRIRELSGCHRRLTTVHEWEFCREYPDAVDILSVQNWAPQLYHFLAQCRADFPQKPIFCIENGAYDATGNPLFEGAYIAPERCFERFVLTIFSGVYPNYYWQHAAWYEIRLNLADLPPDERPAWSNYSNLFRILDQHVKPGFHAYAHHYLPPCLTNGADVFIFYLDGDLRRLCGKIPALRGRTVSIVYTGLACGRSSDAAEATLDQEAYFEAARPFFTRSQPTVAVLTLVSIELEKSRLSVPDRAQTTVDFQAGSGE